MKLVIFDIDGTLCNSNYIDDKCYIWAFKNVTSMDIRNTDWDLYKNPTEPGIIEQLFQEHFGRKPDIREIKDFIKRYVEFLKDELEKDSACFQEVPGSKSLLKYLETHPDFEVGIATGGFGESAIFKLKKLGFDISNILISHSDDFKLKREIIGDLIHKMNEQKGRSDFEKIIYVGDREYDYKTAQELNIDFIGVDFKQNGVLKTLGVEKIVSDYVPKENFLNFLK